MTNRAGYTLDDLLYLMARLRDPDTGCPWDLAQDFRSIVPHTLEEAYEVADAIERQDFAHLPSELGDLLFQVVYYAQMGREQNRFDFATVVDSVVTKLVRRHPHVFPDGCLRATADPARGQVSVQADDVADQWQAIKAQERAEQAAGVQSVSILDDVPLNMPALSRAVKLQKRVAKVGFDWTDTAQIIAKINEEVAEVQHALNTEDQQAVEHEIGDLLFAVSNLARFLDIDPEQSVRQMNARFSQRFTYIEQQVAAQGLQLTDCDLATLDALWDEAKLHLAGENASR